MRPCPICEEERRTRVFSTTYQIPDGWPLPAEISWYICDWCGMLYGDGDFDQTMLDDYYNKFYGYGVNNPENVKRLGLDAAIIAGLCNYDLETIIVDFGGRGDDGRSVIVDELFRRGFLNASARGPGENLPDRCKVIYASHVMEHIYDLPHTMWRLVKALDVGGTLIIDVPDAMGLLQKWKMPILDFNTKHINHFTLRNLLDLGHYWGLEAILVKPYEIEFAPCYHVHFKRLDVAQASMDHVSRETDRMVAALSVYAQEPVNIWGLGDVTWHLLSRIDMPNASYIDNDPAFRGQTFNGKPILERPENDAPILILAQGQRKRLIENIRKMGIQNRIIEI